MLLFRPLLKKNPMPRLISGADHPVELGKELGRGGEGAVYEIGAARLCRQALSPKPVDADKALKLQGMARQAHPSLLAIAAWPVDVLRSGFARLDPGLHHAPGQRLSGDS